jgi:hypothetical protein
VLFHVPSALPARICLCRLTSPEGGFDDANVSSCLVFVGYETTCCIPGWLPIRALIACRRTRSTAEASLTRHPGQCQLQCKSWRRSTARWAPIRAVTIHSCWAACFLLLLLAHSPSSILLPDCCLQPAASRFVLLMLWMSSTGLGLVQGKDIVQAARRLRVT